MKIIHFNEIDSTNAYLIREHASLDNMTICEADFQSAGKGREDRVWLSKRYANVMFSILIKDKELIDKYAALSVITGLLVRNYIASYEIDNVTVKWPNDVYVNDKKICGILLQGQIPNYLVIGVGINVNQTEFDGDYRKTPTSVLLETNRIIDIRRFKKGLYIYIDEQLDLFKRGLYDPLNEIRKYNYLKGKETDLGKVVDINFDYSLKVETKDGIKDISTGEIKEK